MCKRSIPGGRKASVGLAQKLSSSSSILYRYVYRHVVASNLQIAVEEIPLFSQNTEVSEFDVNWVRDRRNSVSDPSRGDFENVDVSMAMKPIGSSANFIRVYLQNSTYTPIGRRLVFARSTRFGIQTVYGNSISTDIPLPERFFAGGGTSLRGFGLNQAGPRDPVTGFPIGGQAELIFNQDLRFPMHLPLIGDRLGGAVFYDAGNVFPSIRKISLRTAPPAPTFDPANPNVCLTNCTNELSYFSHTVGIRVSLWHADRTRGARSRLSIEPGAIPDSERRHVPGHHVGGLPDNPCEAPRVPILHQLGDDVLMRHAIFIFVLLLTAARAPQAFGRSAPPQSARVVDRIVARIEGDIILQSQVRELGAFQELIDGHAESDDKLLEELIEQWVVETEATASHFPQPAQSEVDRELARLKGQFANSGEVRVSSERARPFRRSGAAIAEPADLCRALRRL